MEAFFLEDPTYVIMFSILAVCAMGAMLASTGRVVYLYVMIGVLGVGMGLVAIERFIVTDRELVEDAVYKMADAITAGDLPAVHALIGGKDAQKIRNTATSTIRGNKVTEASVNNLEIELNYLTPQPTAIARMGSVIHVGVKEAGGMSSIPVVVNLTLTYSKLDGEWLLTDYEYTLGIGGF